MNKLVSKLYNHDTMAGIKAAVGNNSKAIYFTQESIALWQISSCHITIAFKLCTAMCIGNYS